MTNPTRRDDELIRRGDAIAAIGRSVIYNQTNRNYAMSEVNAIPAANPAQGGEILVRVMAWPDVTPMLIEKMVNGAYSAYRKQYMFRESNGVTMTEHEGCRAATKAVLDELLANGKFVRGRYETENDSPLASSPAAPAAVAQEEDHECVYENGDGICRTCAALTTPPPSASDTMVARACIFLRKRDVTADDVRNALNAALAAQAVDALAAPAVAREVDDAMVARACIFLRQRDVTADDVRKALTAALSPPSPLGGGGES